MRGPEPKDRSTGVFSNPDAPTYGLNTLTVK